jgi:hypothetical protein
MWAKIAIFFAKLERLFWIGFGFVLVPIASLCLPDRHMHSPASLAGADPDQRRKN